MRVAAPLTMLLLLAAPRALVAQTRAAEAVVPPRVMRVVEPQFPTEMSGRTAPVSVDLLIEIDASGRVSGAQLSRSCGVQALDERALAAIREFEFEPARRGQEPIAVRIRYRYVFAPPPPSNPVDEDAPRVVANSTITAQAQRSALPPSPGRIVPEPASNRPANSATNSPQTPPDDNTQEVTVYGRVPSREMTRREVTAEEVRRIPGVRGDALLAVQNLPGVARPQFGLGQFVIRSAPPEETLVTLEGHPIGSPFHLYGLASSIATDLIERIEMIPGNFSARYGRVSGGVVNVTLRAPRRDRVVANVDVDVIDAGAFVSVPLGRRASIAAGARISYISLLAPLVFAPGTGGFRQWPTYWDWQLAFDCDLTQNDSIRVVGSGTNDAFINEYATPDPNDPSIRGQIRSQTTFQGVQARWRHRLGNGATHTLSAALGYQLQDVNLGPSVRYHFEAITGSLRDELDYKISSQARLFLGIDATVLASDDQVRAPPVSTSGLTDPTTPTTLVTYRAFRTGANPAAYAELELTPTDTVKILAGMRADYFSLAHSMVADPRVNAQWRLWPWWTVRAGVGAFSGTPKSYAALPGFGNPLLRPERWMHAHVGSEWQIIPGALEVDVAAFVKNGASVVAPSDRVVVRDGQSVAERFSNDGVARVYGTELQLRMRPGRLPLFAMLAYTFQRSERALCAACHWTTYTWDQPHILSASIGALLPKGFELGVRVRVSSGLVEPYIIGALYDADHDVAITLVDRDSVGRLPAFFSLDVRGSWRFRAGPLRGQLILEVLNATNNSNVESRIYSFDRRASQPVLGLPILPSLGVRLEY